MTTDPTPSPDDRALDEMTAALREAGAPESQSLPPEVRRATLQALWVADAGRYQGRSERNTKAVRVLTVGVVLAAVLAGGAVFVRLATRAWEGRNDPRRQYGGMVRNVTPPPATHPVATQPTSTRPTNPAPPTPAPPPASGPAVAGRVVFLGTPPEPEVINLSAVRECQLSHPTMLDESLVVGPGGGLANAVVSLERADGTPLVGPPPSAPAVLDQRGCQYVPHVLAVTVGQPIVVKNSDPFLHNVHSMSTVNPAFNFGQPSVDPGRTVNPMKAAERFRIKCDVHPWMTAHVSVFDHPHFAVTKPDGAYAIPGKLPDGYYTVTAWHEKLGEKKVSVRVTDGSPASADFVFDGVAPGEE